MNEACTIGARIVRSDDEYIVFKNKDFARGHLDDKIVLASSYFSVEGVTTWDADGTRPDRFAGFSIGINDALLSCCCSNVRSIDEAFPYDLLVRCVVEGSRTFSQAVSRIKEEVRRRPYVWGNLLIATPQEVGVIEVRDRIKVERSQEFAVRANHHLVFGQSPLDDDQDTTENRLNDAREKIERSRSVEDVLALCRSHMPEKGHSSICRHGPPYSTVYSYIIHVKDGEIDFHVCQGNPCEGKYSKIPIKFYPAEQDVYSILTSYPSRYYRAGATPED